MARTVWYPGHMAKGKRQMAALSGHLDLLLEVRDARAPRLTESPMLGDFPPSLEIWTVLSKADLADPEATSEWLDEFKRRKRMAWALDLRRGVPGSVKKAILSLRPKSSFQKIYREVRVAVAGIPNVGKSMLLNALVGRKAASVGGIPGVTKGVSWFTGQGCLIADSPGILDPRSDARVHRMLSWLSSTKGEVIGSWAEHACECLFFLQRRGIAHVLKEVWGIDGNLDPREVLLLLGKRFGKLLPGGTIDIEASGKAFIEALAGGRIGRISLERPSSPEPWSELS